MNTVDLYSQLFDLEVAMESQALDFENVMHDSANAIRHWTIKLSQEPANLEVFDKLVQAAIDFRNSENGYRKISRAQGCVLDAISDIECIINDIHSTFGEEWSNILGENGRPASS